jgi:hypothetical protein
LTAQKSIGLAIQALNVMDAAPRREIIDNK